MSKKKTHHCKTEHPDHTDQLSRLNRIGGQVEGIKKMIEERRYCPDILIQMRAVRSALQAIEGNLLERHLDSCVNDAFATGSKSEKDKKIAELKELYRRFGD